MNKHGVLLIELLVSITLLFCTIFIISTRIDFFNRAMLRTHVDAFFGHCMALRQAALTDHADHKLVVDIKTNRYWTDGREYQLNSGVSFGFLPGTKGPPSSPIHYVNSSVTFTHNEIIFHKDGIIDSGTVYLVDRKRNAMYAISSPIAQFSFLRKYRYDDGKWHIL